MFPWDAEELAQHLCGLDEDADEDAIESGLSDRYSIDLAGFSDLIEALLPLIDVAEGPLSGKVYQGFAVRGEGEPGKRYNRWLAKIERPVVPVDAGRDDRGEGG